MDLPVTLNTPAASGVGLEAGSATLGQSGASGEGFSKQLEKNVGLLKEGTSDEHVVTDNSKGVEISNAQGLTEGIVPKVDVTVDVTLAEGFKASELNGDFDALPVSGNDLPNINVVDVEATFNMVTTQIIFDPLSKPQEIPVQMTEQVMKPLLPETLTFNGKNSGKDFFAGAAMDIAGDKAVFESATKVLANTGLAAELTQQLGGKQVAVSVDVLPSNLTQGVVLPNSQVPLQQAAAERPTLQLDTPVGTSRWGQDFSQRIQWVVNQSMSGAQIKLNPQNMGPVEVRVQMQNDQISLSFTAQHGATREAIEAALPRLREMFSEQNINMADVDISQHSFSEQRERHAAGEGNDEFSLFNEKDGEADDGLFDAAENEQRIQYTGLFNGFA